MKGRMKRRGELIVIPGSPPSIVDGDPGKRLTRASLLYIFSNGGNDNWITSTVQIHGPAGLHGHGALPWGSSRCTRSIASKLMGTQGNISARPRVWEAGKNGWTGM